MNHLHVAKGARLPAELRRILDGAGVTIARRNASAWELGPGETMAVGVLLRLYRERGAEHLGQVLEIARTRPRGLSADVLRAVSLLVDVLPERLADTRDALASVNLDTALPALRGESARESAHVRLAVSLASRMAA